MEDVRCARHSNNMPWDARRGEGPSQLKKLHSVVNDAKKMGLVCIQSTDKTDFKVAAVDLASYAGVFRGARFSSLPTNAVCGEG